MICTFSAYVDFCYLVRRNVLDEDTLDQIDDAIHRFHRYRVIFKEVEVREDTARSTAFSLPRQHAVVHYRAHIENFGAPNGLCSSITESKHIVAVKKPWHRSSRYEALRQMLVINSRTDKLSAACRDFHARGMMRGTCLSHALATIAEEDEDGPEAQAADNFGEDGDDGGAEYDMEANNNILADRRAAQMERECGSVAGPALFNEVLLSQTKRKSHFISIYPLVA